MDKLGKLIRDVKVMSDKTLVDGYVGVLLELQREPDPEEIVTDIYREEIDRRLADYRRFRYDGICPKCYNSRRGFGCQCRQRI